MAAETGGDERVSYECDECEDVYDKMYMFKIYFTKFFKSEFGRFKWRKAMEGRVLCQNCVYALLEFGAKAGWHPLYIKKIKRIGKYTKKSVLVDYYIEKKSTEEQNDDTIL